MFEKFCNQLLLRPFWCLVGYSNILLQAWTIQSPYCSAYRRQSKISIGKPDGIPNSTRKMYENKKKKLRTQNWRLDCRLSFSLVHPHTHTHTGRSRIRCSEFSCMRIPLFLAKKQEKNTSIFTPSLCALTQCLFIKRQHVCSCVVCVCVLCRMPMGGKTAHTTSTKYQKKNPKQKHEDENSIFLRFFFLVSRAFEGKQTCCWPRFNQN